MRKLNEEEYKISWISRMLSHTVKAENGCWIWQLATNHGGYPQSNYRDRHIDVHRWMYKIFNNVELTTEQDVMHSCDTTKCINPAHLSAGTRSDNMKDMESKGRGHQSRKTHCIVGHEYSVENTYVLRNKRYCRECARINQRKSYARKRGGL